MMAAPAKAAAAQQQQQQIQQRGSCGSFSKNSNSSIETGNKTADPARWQHAAAAAAAKVAATGAAPAKATAKVAAPLMVAEPAK